VIKLWISYNLSQ